MLNITVVGLCCWPLGCCEKVNLQDLLRMSKNNIETKAKMGLGFAKRLNYRNI